MTIITITREDNKYNKYMKWHLICKHDNGCTRSEWFKTQKEAEQFKTRSLNADHEKYCLNINHN